MALSQPRVVYGIHSVTPYNTTDGMPYGTLKVLKGSSLSLEGTINELFGGSSKFPWAAEEGEIKAEMSLKFSEYPDFCFQLFLGNSVTTNAAEATGSASALTNKKGTSVQKVTTGIASVAVLSGSEDDLKAGLYVVKAVTATTVDVYCLTDIDFSRGVDGSFQNDSLKVNASPLTITTAGNINVPNFGIKLVGGSGTIAMVSGDTATFEVRPINVGSTEVVIGGSVNQTFPEFGALVIAQRRGNQELFEIECYKCKAAGMPIGFDQNAFSEAEVKVKVQYDSVNDGVFKVRHIKPA